MNPWFGMALVAGTLGGLIGTLRIVQKRYEPHPEVVRKLLHIIMGLVTLTLPWLFDAVWPVLVLSILTVVALTILKRSKLKGDVGQVLHGVARDSQGDILFPISVGLLFYFSNGNPVLFCVPMLTLTLADATAALVGLRYGKSTYGTIDSKSIEGSVAFFLVTFLSVHFSLLLFTQTGRFECVLIALKLGLLVMMLEAISWQGLDNLFIPLGGFLLLKNYLSMDVVALVSNFLAVLFLIAVIALLRRRSAMDAGATMATALTAYLIWATAGWLWMIAPFVLFLTYSLLLPTELKQDSSHSVHAVVSAMSPGFVWLFLAQSLNEGSLFFPYTLSFAVYLAIIGLSRVRLKDGTEKTMPDAKIVAQSIGVAWLVIVLPFVLLQSMTMMSWLLAGMAVLVVAAGAWTFYYVQPSFKKHLTDTPLWIWQSSITAAMSCLGLIPLYLL